MREQRAEKHQTKIFVFGLVLLYTALLSPGTQSLQLDGWYQVPCYIEDTDIPVTSFTDKTRNPEMWKLFFAIIDPMMTTVNYITWHNSDSDHRTIKIT